VFRATAFPAAMCGRAPSTQRVEAIACEAEYTN
jgi:hypothetical protein